MLFFRGRMQIKTFLPALHYCLRRDYRPHYIFFRLEDYHIPAQRVNGSKLPYLIPCSPTYTLAPEPPSTDNLKLSVSRSLSPNEILFNYSLLYFFRDVSYMCTYISFWCPNKPFAVSCPPFCDVHKWSQFISVLSQSPSSRIMRFEAKTCFIIQRSSDARLKKTSRAVDGFVN